MGSWITYGLGTENEDLPGYITVCPTLTHGGVNAYSSAFLPAAYQGTPIGNASIPADQAKIPYIVNAGQTPLDVQRMELDYLQSINRQHLEETGPDAAREGRINSFELAYRMQIAAPHLQEIEDETAATRRAYGLDNPVTANFGRQCLMARRFAERGVRFVQVTHSYKWDQHAELKRDHEKNAAEVDQPIAALLRDLKARGMLEDTLVLWGGEFGRTPVAQGDNGRDHNPQGYTMWLAGGGVKAGIKVGETDELGSTGVGDRYHVKHLHATILHLMGVDPNRLGFLHAGLNQRLVGTEGAQPIRELLA